MQFDVFEHKSKGNYPLFVVVQSDSDIVETPGYYMAAPLIDASLLSSKVSKELIPVVYLNGVALSVKTTDMVAVPEKAFGQKVGSLSAHETDIQNAINILFLGV